MPLNNKVLKKKTATATTTIKKATKLMESVYGLNAIFFQWLGKLLATKYELLSEVINLSKNLKFEIVSKTKY